MPDKEKRRQEIKRLVAENGLSDFTDENVLELLLFYATTKQETIQVAQRLIQTYGSFRGVFEAPASDMLRVEGMNNEGAQFLSLVGQVSRRCELIKARTITKVTTPKDAAEYLMPIFVNERVELMYMICLDAEGNIIATKELNRGVAAHAIFNYRHVAQEALTFNAASIILCHNHPGGDEKPSIVDERTAVNVNSVMAAIGIRVYDHIVISGRNYSSLRERGYMKYREIWG